jgi:hypothetical protein
MDFLPDLHGMNASTGDLFNEQINGLLCSAGFL